MMKVWITRYALTSGISEENGEQSEFSPNMVSYGRYGHAHGEGKQWHKSLSEAIKRAEVLRTKKIASLRASIAKLEALRFDA